MNIYKQPIHKLIKQFISCLLAFVFLFSQINLTFIPNVNAQSVLNLPVPGTMLNTTAAFAPTILRGITIDPANPFKFNFLVDLGDDKFEGENLKAVSDKLIKYFLASLTVPEKDLWVNLSPYEKNRIIPPGFSQTEMGRDLLAQDYMLKQLTASLLYPDNEFGSAFWEKVYKKVEEKYGTTDLPLNTFNKVWIIPDKAVVYVHNKSAFVIESHLKVLLEEDYLALEANQNRTDHGLGEVKESDLKEISAVSKQVIKEILIPEIEREVNEGRTFSSLRQIYNSVILASWYKNNLKESVLGQVYMNQNKTKGVDVDDREITQKIYQQYLDAFKSGAYDTVKEDYNPQTQEVVTRKYVSGGAALNTDNVRLDMAMSASVIEKSLAGRQLVDVAMNADPVAGTETQNINQSNLLTPYWIDQIKQRFDDRNDSISNARATQANLDTLINSLVYAAPNASIRNVDGTLGILEDVPLSNENAYNDFLAEAGKNILGQWNRRGWKNISGRLSPYLVYYAGSIQGVDNQNQAFNRSMALVRDASLDDQLWAYWSLVIGLAMHVRHFGPHVLEDGDFMDLEMLKKVGQKMIPVAVAWLESDQSANPNYETERNLLLDGLEMMLDPLIYRIDLLFDYSGFKLSDLKGERLNRFELARKRWGYDLKDAPVSDYMTPMLRDLEEVDRNGQKTGNKLDNTRVNNLLKELIGRSKSSNAYLQMAVFNVWWKGLRDLARNDPGYQLPYKDAIFNAVIPENINKRNPQNNSSQFSPADHVRRNPAIRDEYSLQRVLEQGLVKGLEWEGKDVAMLVESEVGSRGGLENQYNLRSSRDRTNLLKALNARGAGTKASFVYNFPVKEMFRKGNRLKLIKIGDELYDNNDKYIPNQYQVREEFIDLLLRIDQEDYVEGYHLFLDGLVSMNKTALLGKKRDNIYITPTITHRRFRNIEEAKQFITERAGEFRPVRSSSSKQSMLGMFRQLKDFNKAMKENKSLDEIVEIIANFYFHADMNLFEQGNNSQYMNMVNCMLRLAGLRGIEHGNLDEEFLLGALNNRRFEAFRNAFVSKVREANPKVFINPTEERRSDVAMLGQVVQYLQANNLYGPENARSQKDLAVSMGRKQIGWEGLKWDIERLQRVGLLEGSKETGYFLPAWTKDVDLKMLITRMLIYAKKYLTPENENQIKLRVERLKTDSERRTVARKFLEDSGIDFDRLSPSVAPMMKPTGLYIGKSEEVETWDAFENRMVDKIQEVSRLLKTAVGIHIMPSRYVPGLLLDTFDANSYVIYPDVLQRMDIDKDKTKASEFLNSFIFSFYDTLYFGLLTQEKEPSVPVALFIDMGFKKGEERDLHNIYFGQRHPFLNYELKRSFEDFLLGAVHWRFEDIQDKSDEQIKRTLAESYLNKLLEIAHKQSASSSDQSMLAQSQAWIDAMKNKLSMYDGSYAGAKKFLDDIRDVRSYFTGFTNMIPKIGTTSDVDPEKLFIVKLSEEERLQLLTEVGEFWLNAWREKGWDKTYGKLSPYLVEKAGEVQGDFDKVLKETKALIKNGSADDKRWALWSMGIGISFHLREYGGHLSSDGKLADQELMKDIIRELIPLVLAWEDDESAQFPVIREGVVENELGNWSYRDFILTGLYFMLDPLLYHLDLEENAEIATSPADLKRIKSLADYADKNDGFKQMIREGENPRVKGAIAYYLTSMLTDLDEIDREGQKTGEKIDSQKVAALVNQIADLPKTDKMKVYFDEVKYPAMLFFVNFWKAMPGADLVSGSANNPFVDRILNSLMPGNLTMVETTEHTASPWAFVKYDRETAKDFTLRRILDQGWVSFQDIANQESDRAELAKTDENIALDNTALDKLARELPGLNLKNAAVVRWKELVRNPLTEPAPQTDNQKIYFKNQTEVRRQLLFLINDVIKGTVIDAKEFSKRLSRIHEILLTGEDGQSIYYPPTMIKKTEENVRLIAGKYSFMVVDYDFEDLFRRLKGFTDLANSSRSVTVNELLDIIFTFFEEDRFIAEDYLFPKGNLSLFMNIVNTMLRLYGLDGIPHTNIDSGYVGNQFRDTRLYFKDQVLRANPRIKNINDFVEVFDQAAVAEKPPGGIDLNPQNMNLQTKGEQIKFQMPEKFRNMDPSKIEGFVPVIINITPVTNLPMLLGDSTESEKEEKLSLAQ